ncbi:Cyclin-dependent kinase D-1 [Linum perenne]
MAENDQEKKVADRYLKREILGEGTYGVVYKAIDTRTGQTVAIKKIRLGKHKECLLDGTEHLNYYLGQSSMVLVLMCGRQPAYLLNFSSADHFCSEDALDLLSKMFTYDPNSRISVQQALEHRYFSSAPLSTEPIKLPRPAPKGQSLNNRVADLSSQDGPTVLSPPRKTRRVMAERESFDVNAHHLDKIDEHGEVRHTTGGTSGRNDPLPMSVDLSVFGTRPMSRPTINSADRTHLKRKLDLEFQ